MSAAAAATADATPKKGKKKLVLILAVVLLLVGGGGAAFLVMKKNAAAAEEEASSSASADGEEDSGHRKPAKKEKKKEDKHALPVFVPLDNFVVNLADRDADRFAQIGITLEVEDAHGAEEIKAYLPAIRNNILLLLAHQTSQELMLPDGKEKLARQVRRVAVLPMGIELEDEDAPEEEATPTPGKKKKRKRFDSLEDSPVKSVQFASFIIQ
jgi:flagellar FliL protein